MPAKFVSSCVTHTKQTRRVYGRGGGGLRCHREWNIGHYYFHIVGQLRGQNQSVDQVTAADLLKYGQKCT